MRRKELAYKNLALGVEFDKYVIEHPEILNKIPSQSTMCFYLNTIENFMPPMSSWHERECQRAKKSFSFASRNLPRQNRELFDPESSTLNPRDPFPVSRVARSRRSLRAA